MVLNLIGSVNAYILCQNVKCILFNERPQTRPTNSSEHSYTQILVSNHPSPLNEARDP